MLNEGKVGRYGCYSISLTYLENESSPTYQRLETAKEEVSQEISEGAEKAIKLHADAQIDTRLDANETGNR
ncbi:hypothetical protein [Pseudidiomarina sp.]|uniref:hypothetical protein n=1 Tax=Pseudidiomarina sp. TaxID=2081707 RepID=UPI003A984FB3